MNNLLTNDFQNNLPSNFMIKFAKLAFREIDSLSLTSVQSGSQFHYTKLSEFDHGGQIILFKLYSEEV